MRPARRGRGQHTAVRGKQLAYDDSRSARAAVALSSEDLVVEGTHVETELLPRVEVVRGRDRAACAVGLADGPVLVERRSALDGRLVDAGALVDVVGRAVGGDGALVGEAAARVVGAEALDDVVLDEWARGPTVHGEVRVAGGRVVRVEVDVPGKVERVRVIQMRIREELTWLSRGSSPCQQQSCRSSASSHCTDQRRRWSS